MTSSPGLATFSPAAIAFDRCADSYDGLFTGALIGRAQRSQVWPRLLKAFSPGSRILELNCGTGEDACFLADHGCAVLACDASEGMLTVARRRTKARNLATRVELLQVANEDLARLCGRTPFQGAFSNFSGLNCVADLQHTAKNLARLIAPGGHLLLCLWSRTCLAEIVWYVAHGRPSKAFRRLRGRSTATLGGMTVSVFYPSVRSIRKAFSSWFVLESQQAIGLFVPPTYMEQWVQAHRGLFSKFESADKVCTSWPVLRGLGDHVLLEFVRCNP